MLYHPQKIDQLSHFIFLKNEKLIILFKQECEYYSRCLIQH